MTQRFAGISITKTALTVALLGGLSILLAFSLYLAAMRIYQVDECLNVSAARLLATGQKSPGAGLFQFVLSRLLPDAAASVDLFASARLVMVLIFWSNWILIALATGERLLSNRWLMALVGAASLAPFWDYGFEIRQNNLMLSGLLLLWSIVRFGPPRPSCCFMVGAIAAGLEFVTFRALLFTLPFSLALLAFPPPGRVQPRWKLAAAWAAGVVAAFVVVRIVLQMSGLSDLAPASSDFRAFAPGPGYRLALWDALGRLLNQAPLLLALAVAALISVTADAARRGRAALTWEGNLPEALLVLGILAVLLADPSPSPNRLLQLAPYAYLLVFRYASRLLRELSNRAALLPLAGAILVFTHFLPFTHAVRRHLGVSHGNQETLMTLAEKLTDPMQDPVYDAVGMVPTRPIIEGRALPQSLNSDRLMDLPGPQVRDGLAARPPAVIIPNSRTDLLSREVHVFIRERYVCLADDFLVLGKVLRAGGGAFEIIHPGRYRISSLQGSDLKGTYPAGWEGLFDPEKDGALEGTLDGAPFSSGVRELAVGEHRIETAPGSQAAVVWVGPRADRIHRVHQGDHERLFPGAD